MIEFRSIICSSRRPNYEAVEGHLECRDVFNEGEEKSKVHSEVITGGYVRVCIRGDLMIGERKSFQNFNMLVCYGYENVNWTNNTVIN